MFDGLINNCNSYENGRCSGCDDGYSLSGNTCHGVNLANCEKYTGITCTACKSGNYVNGSGTCSTIKVANCSAADVNGKCTQCNSSNLALSRTNTCIEGKTLANGTTLYKIGDYYAASVPRSSGGTYHAFTGETNAPDLWLGAKNSCEAQGLHLPDRETLKKMLPNVDESNSQILNDTTCYWTSEATSHRCDAGYECVHYGVCNYPEGLVDAQANNYSGFMVLCVE